MPGVGECYRTETREGGRFSEWEGKKRRGIEEGIRSGQRKLREGEILRLSSSSIEKQKVFKFNATFRKDLDGGRERSASR